VAYLAFALPLVAVLKGKIVDAQISRSPTLGGVAVLTVQAKQTGVQDGFSVAFYALSRRAGENFVYMASSAIDLRVATFQEKHSGMVELVHAIDPIVAVQAKAAELVNVFGHEGGS